MEACIRALLRHEDVAVVVRGPIVALVHHQDARGRLGESAGCSKSTRPMRGLAARLHLDYVGREDADRTGGSDSALLRDFIHSGEEAHRYRGWRRVPRWRGRGSARTPSRWRGEC